MKKVLYTVLSILAIAYIAFLIVHEVDMQTDWEPNFGGFAPWFDFIVKFGGVAIIFCFALVNFAGSPLKTVFFILLILAIICYVVVIATPESFYNVFQ